MATGDSAKLGGLLLGVGALVFAAYLALLGLMTYRAVEAGAAAAKPKYAPIFAKTPGLGGDNFTLRCFGDVGCSAKLNEQFADSPLRLIAGLGILPVLLLGVGFALRVRCFERKDPGAQRWASRGDLETAQLLMKPGEQRSGYYGLFKTTKEVVRVREDVRNRHTLVVSGPGGGKTSGYYRTNILCDAREGNASVVFDLKYPDKGGLFDAVTFYRYYGRKAVVFAPFTSQTYTLPILDLIKTQTECNIVAKVMVPNTPMSDEFHRGNAQDVLEALLWASKNTGKLDLGWLFELLKQGIGPVKTALIACGMQREYGDVLGLKDDQFAGAVRNARKALESLTDPVVIQSLGRSANSLDLEALLETPCLIYVGMPGIEIRTGRGQMLLRLFKHFSDQAIQAVATRHDMKLPYQTNIYLDEFRGFGLIPFIQNDLAERRSYRLAIHAALQNLAQGEAVYGKAEFESMKNSNFQNVVLFPAGIGLEEADYFSKLIGDMTDLETGKGNTVRGFGDSSSSKNERLVKRRLIEAAEFKVYPEGQAIVMPFGAPPVRVLMPRLDEPSHPLHKLYAAIQSWEASEPAFAIAPTPALNQYAFPLVAQTPAPSHKAALVARLRGELAAIIEARAPLTMQMSKDGVALEVITTLLSFETVELVRGQGWITERETHLWLNQRGVKALGASSVAALSIHGVATKVLIYAEKHPEKLDDATLPVSIGHRRHELRVEQDRALLTFEKYRRLHTRVAPEQLHNTDLATKAVYEVCIPLVTPEQLGAMLAGSGASEPVGSAAPAGEITAPNADELTAPNQTGNAQPSGVTAQPATRASGATPATRASGAAAKGTRNPPVPATSAPATSAPATSVPATSVPATAKQRASSHKPTEDSAIGQQNPVYRAKQQAARAAQPAHAGKAQPPITAREAAEQPEGNPRT